MEQFDGILSGGKCQKLGLQVTDKWTCGQIQTTDKPALYDLFLPNEPDPKKENVHFTMLYSYKIMKGKISDTRK